jgi:YD repeat-containing protein
VVQVKDAQNNVATYEYEPFGNLAKATDAAGNVATYAYDTRGRKVTANDPDLGTSTFTYDVLDKLTTQTNAASEVTALSYDLLGRLVQRVEPGLTSAWAWDSSGPRASASLPGHTNGGYTHHPPTMPDARPGADHRQQRHHAITTAYDAASRVSKVTTLGLRRHCGYNATGYQHQPPTHHPEVY